MRRGQFFVLVLAMVVSGLVGGAAAGLLTGSRVEAKEQVDLNADSSGGIVTARQIQLLDEKGNPRAVLGFDNDKNPVLLFFDKHGKNGSYLGQTSHDGSLRFMDSSGQARLHISLGDNGLPGIYLLEGTKKIRASLSVASDNNPFMSITDSNGKPCLMAGLEKDAEPVLFLKKQGWRQPIRLV